MTLDPIAGQLNLDDALDRVDEHASEDWKMYADLAYVEAATRAYEFTNDLIWVILEDEWGIDPPHERRALGARSRAAATAGRITATGRYQPSDRPGTHRNPIMVYRSLIYRGES
jgi:hypothetical protein